MASLVYFSLAYSYLIQGIIYNVVNVYTEIFIVLFLLFLLIKSNVSLMTLLSLIFLEEY